ncbi:hypothetical protein [Peribacillus butanolivorans]|uniref:hypothetical protein n=1 Tax=Peribacillus butanolivorans TaxID=421767 RepID=UPI00366AA448
MKEAVGDGVELIEYRNISFFYLIACAVFTIIAAAGLNLKKGLSFKDPLVISSGKQP